jgi:integrase/recombinase XerD
MKEEFIDVRGVKRGYERARRKFEKLKRISEKNKELVTGFLDDAAIGKTIIGRAKKKIGPGRLHTFVTHLTTLIAFVKKDLDEIEQGDMERFIRALEYDEIRSKRKELWGRPSTIEKRTLSERYKVDIKMTVRKFYKWLWGNSRTYPPIVEWIDTSARATEIPALTEAEVSRMLESCSTVLQRALIQVLFDGGFRASELLNVRLKHVRSVEIENDHGTAPCFVLRVCFSKTLSRTVPLPMEASAKWLGMWLANHPEEPVLQPDGTVKARNLDAQLFPITVGGMGRLLREIGRRSIGKHVWPHLMRHTSATWWSNHVSHYKLCKRFGWSMTSDMPKRYIDREGVDEMEVAKVIRANPARGVLGKPDVESSSGMEKQSVQVGIATRGGETVQSILQFRLARGEIDLPTFRELSAELGAPLPGYVG